MSASAQFNTVGPAGVYKKDVSASTKKVKTDTVIAIKQNQNVRETNTEPVVWYHPPLKGKIKISSKFGKRRNPFGKRGHEHHSGLDLSAKSGTPIYAMLPGEVLAIGYDTRSGNFIKLKHGNFTVSYCHLIRKPNLKIGSHVLPGQPVAQVGSTGRSTGPHLHITLKKNGQVLDPAILLDFFKF